MFYKGKNSKNDICVVIVDDTHEYKPWMRELVKNTADYTITNVTGIGYDVYVVNHADSILKNLVTNYNIAVVISAGTEFINGRTFFDNLPSDCFLLGHILDMGDGYYGLHYQCYVINLDMYANLNCPEIGETELLSSHVQTVPSRSIENIHDDYTPTWIKQIIKLKHLIQPFETVNTTCIEMSTLATGFIKDIIIVLLTIHTIQTPEV